MATKKKKPRGLKQYVVPLIVSFLLLIPTVFLAVTLIPNGKAHKVPTKLVAKVPVPQRGAYLGVSVPSMDALELYNLQKKLQVEFAIRGVYQSWGAKKNMLNSSFAESVKKDGKILLITWEPWEPVAGFDRSEHNVYQERYLLKHITGGKYDTYITEYAKSLKQYGSFVMIRFAHEMNGNWYSWGSTFNTPEEYRNAWRHVHSLFQKAGATNVTWVWSPNEIYEEERVPYADNIEVFYPGDEYVDWVGFSAFNWAGLYKDNIHVNPEELFTPTIKSLRQFNKPIMITETATAETSDPLHKSRWIGLLATYIKDTPEIKGLVWFNAEDNGINWRLESSTASIEAFRHSFDSYFLSR